MDDTYTKAIDILNEISSLSVDANSFEVNREQISLLYKYLIDLFKAIDPTSGAESGGLQALADIVINHINDLDNPHLVTPLQIGLGNVDNTADLDKPISTLTQSAIDAVYNYVNSLSWNFTSHISNLDNPHQTTYDQVGFSDVFPDSTITPPTTLTGLSVTLSNGQTIVLSENPDISQDPNIINLLSIINTHIADLSNPHTVTKEQVDFTETGISPNLQLNITFSDGSTSRLAMQTDLQTQITQFLSHIQNYTNPHNVTAVQIGLGNVDNTSDMDKPVSTAQANSIAIVQTNINTHIANNLNPHNVTASQVGLGNVQNLTPYDMPISNAVNNLVNPIISNLASLTSTVQNNSSDIQTNIVNIQNNANMIHALESMIAQIEIITISQPYLSTSDIANPNSNTIYLIGSNAPYSMYIYADGNFYQIGSFEVDISNLATKSYVQDIQSTLNTSISNVLSQLNAQIPIIQENVSNISLHVADLNNPHNVTKEQLGLGNVDNTPDIDKPISSQVMDYINSLNSQLLAVNTTLTNLQDQITGIHNIPPIIAIENLVSNNSETDTGFDTLAWNGVFGTSMVRNLPLQYSNMNDNVVPYLLSPRNFGIPNQYQPDTSPYLNGRLRLVDGIKTLEMVADNFLSIQSHRNNRNNPHNVTAQQVGLGNVDNTRDIDKPVSNPQRVYISQFLGSSGTLPPAVTMPVSASLGRGMYDVLIGQRSGPVAQPNLFHSMANVSSSVSGSIQEGITLELYASRSLLALGAGQPPTMLNRWDEMIILLPSFNANVLLNIYNTSGVTNIPQTAIPQFLNLQVQNVPNVAILHNQSAGGNVVSIQNNSPTFPMYRGNNAPATGGRYDAVYMNITAHNSSAVANSVVRQVGQANLTVAQMQNVINYTLPPNTIVFRFAEMSTPTLIAAGDIPKFISYDCYFGEVSYFSISFKMVFTTASKNQLINALNNS